MKEIEVSSTSRFTATANDIILRETSKSRLIFRPLILDNQKNKEASVKGTFIYQRKSINDIWTDYTTLSLNHLKKDEWIKLALTSSEILELYQHLGNLYKLYEAEGQIPMGKTRYVRADEGLISLLHANESELSQILNHQQDNASLLLSKLLQWFLKIENPEQIIESIEYLENEKLQQISSLIGLSTLRTGYEIWEDNKENSNEEFWQRSLSDYSFILSQIFSHPVIIVKDKAYVGGKNFSNTGGKLVDFLAQNDISKNAVLIEIKTPKTNLLGPAYRNGYSISSELSGTVVQIADYKRSLEHEFSNLKIQSDFEIESFEPSCVIIAGNYKKELNNPDKRKAFELFRSHLQGVEIITYDELFSKVRLLIELLEGKPLGENMIAEDEIPF